MLKVENTRINTEIVTSSDSVLVRPFIDMASGLFLLRLIVGIVFIAHGSQKVFGWFGGPGLQGTVGFMGNMGIPAILAYTAAFTEFLGGIALILGLLTRVAALGLVIDMAVAIILVHLNSGFFAPKGFEYPLSLGAVAL